MKVTTESITPTIARKMLERNRSNRAMNPTTIEMVRRDILGGHWRLNGDTIRFDTNRDLMDGQNRLTGCIASGKPIQTLVIRGLPPEARDTIDAGAKRTIGQRFSMDGVRNANQVGSAIGFIAQVAFRNPQIKLTPSETRMVFDANPEIVDSSGAGNFFPGMGKILVGLHHIGSKLGFPDVATDFVEVFRTGVPAYENDPAHRFREKIIAMRASMTPMRSHLLRRGACRAFVLFSQGESRKAIHIPDELMIPGWTPEKLGLAIEK